MNKEDHNRKAIIFSSVIIITALLLLFSSYKVFQERIGRIAGNFFYPYLRLARLTTDASSGQTLLSHSELAAKVEHLERLNRQLALQAANAAELYQENEDLRNRLNLKTKPLWSVLTGEIILRDPVLWRERFFISIGKEHGIKRGCAVFDLDLNNNPILVGIIGSVRDKSSEVITIFNPEFRFSAKVGSNDNIGFVNTGIPMIKCLLTFCLLTLKLYLEQHYVPQDTNKIFQLESRLEKLFQLIKKTSYMLLLLLFLVGLSPQ